MSNQGTETVVQAEPVDQPTSLASAQEKPSEVKAIAKPNPAAGLTMGLMTFAEAERFAMAAASSKLTGATSPQQALMVIKRAQECGIGPATALSNMHFINGKATLSADLMVGIVKGRRDICEYFIRVSSDLKQATYETKRVGDPRPVPYTFTMEMAERAELTKNPMWKKYPDLMLRHRCAAFLAREVYPDLLAGLYDPEEMQTAALDQPQRGAPPAFLGKLVESAEGGK